MTELLTRTYTDKAHNRMTVGYGATVCGVSITSATYNGAVLTKRGVTLTMSDNEVEVEVNMSVGMNADEYRELVKDMSTIASMIERIERDIPTVAHAVNALLLN